MGKKWKGGTECGYASKPWIQMENLRWRKLLLIAVMLLPKRKSGRYDGNILLVRIPSHILI